MDILSKIFKIIVKGTTDEAVREARRQVNKGNSKISGFLTSIRNSIRKL